MAQIPGVFNASQYFGNSSPKKSQQDSFWDQQSGSVNHSSGSANSTAAVDPFMTNVQNEFDGWDEWPEDQEFFGNETSHQNHVGPYYDSGSAPGINAGYNNSQLVVPEHSHYNQEDLSESSNSSSVESSPRGMDPELNAWVEEETTPYAFSKYPPPAVVSSHQTIAPQTAASQNSAAGFFDHYFNGDTNGPQSDAGAQSSTSHERTYASVCQAGMPVAPSQDVDYTPNQDYYQDWLAPPTSQAASAPELTNPQDNQLAAETWSREPELGSWSPVFNHEDNSFAGNQQHAPESTVPQIDESTWTNTSSTFEHWSGVGFDATTQQQVHVPPSSTAEPGKGFDSVSHGAEAPPAPSHLQSFDDDAQMYGHDDELNSSSLLFNHDNNYFANNQQGVSEPSVPQIDESTWTNPSSNFQPSLGFDSTMQQEVPPSQLFADGAKEEMENPNAQMSSHDLETHPSFYNEMPAVADSQSGLFSVNKGHHNQDTNKTPQLYQPEIVPVPLFGASAGSLQADPFAVDSTRQNNSLPEQAPGSHFNFFDNVQPEASEENLSEILGNLQPGAFPAFPVKADDDSNLEAPSQEPSEGFPPSMVPPSFQPPVTQASVQQAEPSQYMVEDVPTDLNAHQLEHDQLPSDEKPLADSFGHVPSVDSPSGIFKPNSVVEPMQPHSLVATTAPPLEETPLGLFKPSFVVEQMQPPPEMESSLSDASQPTQQESLPEAIFQASGEHGTSMDGPAINPSQGNLTSDLNELLPPLSLNESTTPDQLPVEPDSPRDALQAAFLQKQLAGKAPAASPRTSLWMNSALLPAPCMLAPAAVATVESSEALRGSDQAPQPSERKLPVPLQNMPLTGQLQQRGPPPNYENQQIPLSRSSQPGNVPPDVITPSPRGMVPGPQHQQNARPNVADVAHSGILTTRSDNIYQQMPAVPAELPGSTSGHTSEPVQSVAQPPPPTEGQDIFASLPKLIPFATREQILQSAGVQTTPAPTQMSQEQIMQSPDVQTRPAPTLMPREHIMQPPDVQTTAAPMQMSREQMTQSGPHAQSTPAPMQMSWEQTMQLGPEAQTKPAATQMSHGQIIQSHHVQSRPAPMLMPQEHIMQPPDVQTRPAPMQVSREQIMQLGPNVQTTPAPMQMSQGQIIQSHHSQSTPAPMQMSREQMTQSPHTQSTPAPMQMSLASLLQGGKGRLKKKTSETSVSSSKTDVGSSQGANLPPQGTPLAPNPFEQQSAIPPSNTVQEISRNSDQPMDSQSFDSVGRTDQGHRPPNETDYRDSYSSENSRSRDEPYYDQDRRDPYYDQDRRDPYYEQGEYDRREHDRREYDRRDHDRRDYDRRDHERRDRREFDRRESDYSRRDYDSREYDRTSREVGRRDYDHRRDSSETRDPYYGYGHQSPRQGRRGYNDGRTSREDLYRGSDQTGYAHSYHSGRSTPSSDRNSPAPAYDYSSPSYAAVSQQSYGYPSYGQDNHSMDMYQYLTMLYYYYPQHYEQYCAQQGYYNTGYTPEQMAQFYGGMPYPPGYETSQPEQAAETEVVESDPARLTPPLYRVQHPLVRFSGGRLISLMSSEDEEEQPKCVIASVQMVFSGEEIEVIKAFPGPLSSMYSSRTEVISYCEQRSSGTDASADSLVKSLIWKILANLVKHNGAFVASDLAELIMENWRSCNTSDQNEFLSAESGPLSSDIEKSKHVSVFREMLLAGATKDALEYTMRYGLWGHAMVLASKMDKKVQNEVTNRFMKTMTDFDPIRTVYDHLSGRQPVALMTPDDWQRNLAAMVANPPRQHPQSNKRNMICLGDTLMANDQVWAAHLCYTLAGERFGYPSDEKIKMALIGIDHRKKMISGQHVPLENQQMMEVLEYAVSLNNEDYYIPVLQTYKYLHANKLSEAGFTDEALHYADLIGHTVIKHPHHFNLTLTKNIKELTDRLNPEAQDAAAAEMAEMLDRLLQAKDSSQISSSVTESEGEVEDPLAESSASFFSGYDPSTNTPKHQVEQTEDIQHQDSWTEPPVTAPPASQDSMGDLRQDSWSGGMDTHVTQPDHDQPPIQQLPSVLQLPPSTIPQPPVPPAPWTDSPPAVEPPPPQPPFFVPGPPITQQLPGQMESEQPAAVEEQSFYSQQPSWNDSQQPSWNNSQQQPLWNDSPQSSWSEGVGYEEPKKVEPPPPKEPEPPAKEEPKPKPSEKAKKKKANNSSQGGWFSGLSGIIQKVIPRGPNEMILPDDSKKSIYWDEDLKKWINTEEDEQEKAVPPPPPPSDMQLGAGMPPAMPPPMPLGFPPNSGAAMKGVNGPAASPFGSPLMPTVPLSQQSSPGMPPGMATPPVASKFSRKAYGGRRHAKKYVDVLNPSGQSSNAPAALPSNLLPMMPGPSTEFKGNFFVPSPVTADTSDERTDEQILDQPPAIGNPSSRPSSRNENEDGGDQQSQHSRSSSVSLTSAEVRSYMMPQDPDPPPQEMNAAPPPMFFDPMAFSQSKAQASPKRSRYPGVRNN